MKFKPFLLPSQPPQCGGGEPPPRADDSAYVVGPLGERLTLEALPPVDTVRWTIRRKAQVAMAVQGGLLSFDDACARYGLAMEELIGWQRAMIRSGMPGLRVTRTQAYRESYERQDRYP